MDDKNIQSEENITQIYDKIFKRILTLSNVAVVNFINGIFSKNFPKNSTLTYNWTENIKNNLEKTIADTIITVNNTKKFHIEVQIHNESIAIRVFDYGYQDALKYKKVEDDRIILKFPQSKVIFLEHNSKTPDTVILELNFGNQGNFEYKIPTMKFLNYSIEELNKQHLVILLPLYLLKLRKEIEKEPSRENALKLKTLINYGIIKCIDDNEKMGNITHEDTVVLIGLLKRLYAYLYGSIQKFKEEGVEGMITDKLILETDKLIYEKEMIVKKLTEAEKAKEKAKEEAKENTLHEVAKNMLNAGMPVEQIKNITKLPLDKIIELQTQKLN
ncbi:MAG: hypothetical protein FWC47_13455 [Oscillospiraceae bacterium]|nr:hypothetical protein [Oscillospiraceae bacterium]